MSAMRRRRDAIDEMLRATGRMGGADGLEPVADMLRALAAPSPLLSTKAGGVTLGPPEVALGPLDVALIGEVARSVRSRGRSSYLDRLRIAAATATAKGLIIVGVLIGGSVAAAATGSLPAPIQHAVARALAGLGIRIPGDVAGAPSRGRASIGSALAGADTTQVPASTSAPAGRRALANRPTESRHGRKGPRGRGSGSSPGSGHTRRGTGGGRSQHGGKGKGHSQGRGKGKGHSHGRGKGKGHSHGRGKGHSHGHGNGPGTGPGPGQGPGNGHGKRPADEPGQGDGPGQEQRPSKPVHGRPSV